MLQLQMCVVSTSRLLCPLFPSAAISSLGTEAGETAEGSEGQGASHPLLGRFISSTHALVICTFRLLKASDQFMMFQQS